MGYFTTIELVFISMAAALGGCSEFDRGDPPEHLIFAIDPVILHTADGKIVDHSGNMIALSPALRLVPAHMTGDIAGEFEMMLEDRTEGASITAMGKDTRPVHARTLPSGSADADWTLIRLQGPATSRVYPRMQIPRDDNVREGAAWLIGSGRDLKSGEYCFSAEPVMVVSRLSSDDGVAFVIRCEHELIGPGRSGSLVCRRSRDEGPWEFVGMLVSALPPASEEHPDAPTTRFIACRPPASVLGKALQE